LFGTVTVIGLSLFIAGRLYRFTSSSFQRSFGGRSGTAGCVTVRQQSGQNCMRLSRFILKT